MNKEHSNASYAVTSAPYLTPSGSSNSSYQRDQCQTNPHGQRSNAAFRSYWNKGPELWHVFELSGTLQLQPDVVVFFLDVRSSCWLSCYSYPKETWGEYYWSKLVSTVFPLWPECCISRFPWPLTPLLIGWHSLSPPLPPFLPLLISLSSSPLSSHLHAHQGGGVGACLSLWAGSVPGVRPGCSI